MKKKLLVTFLPLALIPLVAAGFLSYSLAKRTLTQKALDHLKSIASLQKARVQNFCEQNLERFSLVVVMTTSDIEEDKYRSYDLGASSYIRKPIELKKWKNIIQALSQYWFEIVDLPDGKTVSL